jgi:hypothetical protein
MACKAPRDEKQIEKLEEKQIEKLEDKEESLLEDKVDRFPRVPCPHRHTMFRATWRRLHVRGVVGRVPPTHQLPIQLSQCWLTL